MLESSGELPFKTEILTLKVLYPIHLSSEDQSNKFEVYIPDTLSENKLSAQTPRK